MAREKIAWVKTVLMRRLRQAEAPNMLSFAIRISLFPHYLPPCYHPATTLLPPCYHPATTLL
ncbi:MAG: hypothetical protein V4695_10695, partial [Pseudomonadota bacterium]